MTAATAAAHQRLTPQTPRAWLLWGAVTLLGVGALSVVALHRGEPVNALWIVTAALCTYLVAYRFYALFIATRVAQVDPARATPATRRAERPAAGPRMGRGTEAGRRAQALTRAQAVTREADPGLPSSPRLVPPPGGTGASPGHPPIAAGALFRARPAPSTVVVPASTRPSCRSSLSLEWQAGRPRRRFGHFLQPQVFISSYCGVSARRGIPPSPPEA